jgi:hypothetical protein
MDINIKDNKHIKIKNNKNIIDYNQLLEYLKRKDINNYTEQELKLLTELFSNSGYNINFLNYKQSHKRL